MSQPIDRNSTMRRTQQHESIGSLKVLLSLSTLLLLTTVLVEGGYMGEYDTDYDKERLSRDQVQGGYRRDDDTDYNKEHLSREQVQGGYRRDDDTDYNKEHLVENEGLSLCEYICETSSTADLEAAEKRAVVGATAPEAVRDSSRIPVVAVERISSSLSNPSHETNERRGICRRGCRFFVIVASLERFRDFEESKEACCKSCLEAYPLTDELAACQLGCRSQQPHAGNIARQGASDDSTPPTSSSLSPFLYAHNAYGNMADKVVGKKAGRVITWSYYQQSDDGRMVVVRSDDTGGRREPPAGHDKTTGLFGLQQAERDERMETIGTKRKSQYVNRDHKDWIKPLLELPSLYPLNEIVDSSERSQSLLYIASDHGELHVASDGERRFHIANDDGELHVAIDDERQLHIASDGERQLNIASDGEKQLYMASDDSASKGVKDNSQFFLLCVYASSACLLLLILLLLLHSSSSPKQDRETRAARTCVCLQAHTAFETIPFEYVILRTKASHIDTQAPPSSIV